jgi:hypothetical protein
VGVGRRQIARRRSIAAAREVVASRRGSVATRILAMGALLAVAVVVYVLVDQTQHTTATKALTRSTRTAPEPPSASRTVPRSITEATRSAPPPRPSARGAGATCSSTLGCRYTVDGAFSAIIPVSWRKQIERYPARTRLTLSAGSGEVVEVDYTAKTVPTAATVGHFSDSG